MATLFISRITLFFRVVVIWLALVTMSDAYAAKVKWGFTFGTRFSMIQNGLNSSQNPITFDEGTIGGTFLGGISMNTEFNDQAFLSINFDLGALQLAQRTKGSSSYFVFDMGWITISDPPQGAWSPSFLDILLIESFFLRELDATFYFTPGQWIGMSAGMVYMQLGRALLFDANGLGIRLFANWNDREKGKGFAPIQWSIDAVLPSTTFTEAGKMSPLFHTRLDYVWGKGNKVGLFGAYLYDGDSLASQILQPIFQESILVGLEDLYRRRHKRTVQLNCTPNTQPPAVAAPHALVKQNIKRAYDRLQQCNSGQTQCTDAERQRWEEVVSTPVEVQALELDFQKIRQQLQKRNPAILSPLQHYSNACRGDMESNGHHGWVGLQGNARWGAFKIEGSAILYMSNVNLVLSREPTRTDTRVNRNFANNQRRPTIAANRQAYSVLRQAQVVDDTTTISQDKQLNGLGFAAEMQATFDWHKHFSTSVFFVIETGDNLQLQKSSTFHAFMGLVPQLRYTNIFFNGGINAASSQRNISIAGLTGRGVITPGFIADFHILMPKDKKKDDDDDTPNYKAHAKLVLAPIWSHAPPLTNRSNKDVGQFYGFETDLQGTYKLNKWFEIAAEFDLFFPGNFFAQSQLPVMVKFMVGINLAFK